MIDLLQLALLLLAFALSALFCLAMLKPGSVLFVADRPNHRSLHQQVTPSSGGLAMLAAFFMVLLLAVWLRVLPFQEGFGSVAMGILVLAVLGHIDDRVELSAPAKLIPQMLVAALALFTGWSWHQLPLPGETWHWPSYIGQVATFFYILWMTNLYNFMDGMDGFAAGQALFGFGGLAIFGFLGGNQPFFWLNALVVSVVAGFWVWNFPPARLFMGDSGSLTLGYLAACMILWGTNESLFPAWVGLLLFAPFIVDATWTLARRAIQGKDLTKPHREHAYQVLVMRGWGHGKTVRAAYVLMAAGSLSALMLAQASVWVQWLGFAAWILVYWRILRTVFRREVN